MKATVIIITLFLTMSCSNTQRSNTAPVVGHRSAQLEQTDAQQEQADIPLEQTDAITFATVASNEATFYGIFVLSPGHHATVTLSMDGIVKYTSLLPGKYVRKGELLATLENPEFINLQQNYLEAYAQCEYLEAEYRRQEILSQHEVASQKRFQESRADYLSMKSRKDAAAAQLTMLGLSPQSVIENSILPLLEVRAPISGYITNLHMNTGRYVSAGEPLCEVIDKSNPLIRLTAYEKDLTKIKMGDEIQFTVNGMGNESFGGQIISIGQRVDEVNRSLEVYAKVVNNHSLFRPGMYVNAQVVRK